MSTALQAPAPERRLVLMRRIRLFAAATITYNVVEAVVALWAGGAADSSALIGFGLDSVIEVASAVALSWQFSAKDPERREHLTLRIIALSFFALAAFVTIDAVRSLTGGGEAQHSTPGIIIASLSLAIMPILSWAQRRAGRELGSKTAVADSKQTLLCTYLSAVLLIGLVLNSTLGWWWADAGAALVIAAIAVREGINAWKGDVCCTVPGASEADAAPKSHGTATDDCCGPDSPEPAPAQTLVAPSFETSAEETQCCAGCSTEENTLPHVVATPGPKEPR
ncbi:cation diffusion facilitator family transporter [Paenarthrobacter sp. NPDC018779]|uniref:cation diffusion facilitator family transporter n=1 Tax=Paenarthrobacter sp. NPDC018779 TaxID=3364375 RepID=UPI0037CB7CFE